MTHPEYITTITKLHKSGLATEHSYRGALQQLIETTFKITETTRIIKEIDLVWEV